MRILLIISIISLQVCSAETTDSLIIPKYIGTWWLTEMLDAKNNHGPWESEILCPYVLKIECKNDSLFVRYMDRYNKQGAYRVVITNGGNDIILLNDVIENEFPQLFTSLYHIKVFGDTLRGITYEGVHLYQLFWSKINLSFPLKKTEIDSLRKINVFNIKAKLKSQGNK